MSVEFDIQFSTLQEWIIVQTKRPSAISFVYGLVENEIFESTCMRQVKKKILSYQMKSMFHWLSQSRRQVNLCIKVVLLASTAVSFSWVMRLRNVLKEGLAGLIEGPTIRCRAPQ